MKLVQMLISSFDKKKWVSYEWKQWECPKYSQWTRKYEIFSYLFSSIFFSRSLRESDLIVR